MLIVNLVFYFFSGLYTATRIFQKSSISGHGLFKKSSKTKEPKTMALLFFEVSDLFFIDNPASARQWLEV